jgi:DNA-binding NarL/FixJ family response regulator
MLGALSGGDRGVVTRCRQDVVDNRDWYRSQLVRDYFDPLGMDHCIQSEVWLSERVVHRLAFARAWGDSPFGAPERERVSAFHRALVERSQLCVTSELSPRSKAVLAALVHGKSVKEIGAELELSRASVDREIQALHRRFGVQSRAELLSAAGGLEPAPAAQRAIEGLSPRQRQTLMLLLTGLSERDIACVMGVRHPTLHDYVKSTYRALGVRSRPELMSRFAAGCTTIACGDQR